MKKCLSSYIVLLSLLVASSAVPQAQADVTLPKVIGDHMVLQRDRPLPIWGWAAPDEEVTVKLDEATATAKADAQGNWKVVLPAMKADGKAHAMTISGKNKIELDDILIGEVWIGSGQSNMEFGLGGSIGGKEAIAAANCPQIRLLHVEKVQAPQPAKDIVVAGGAKGKKGQPAPPAPTGPAWKVCTPQNVPGFSAVLYYFGHRLHKDLDVPVGLINSSWGGSPIEAWIVSGPKGGGMYNGMIAPLEPFAIRGAIWYQGEANVNIGLKYADKMKALIEGWRKVWGCDFPFYFVEIAPYRGLQGELAQPLGSPGGQPQDPRHRHGGDDRPGGEHQEHPSREQARRGQPPGPVGLGQGLRQEGPRLLGAALQGDEGRGRARSGLSFAHVGGGLKSRDGKPLAEFEIAAADGKFVPAEATIDGDTVVVQAKEVATPTQARFGWRNEANPNLVNKEGLPASPFQTNNWQGGTGE